MRRLRPLAAAALLAAAAACSGESRFSRAGLVVDDATSAPVAGIRVSCLVGGAQEGTRWVTGADGRFTLFFDRDCEQVGAEDIDGAVNGRYQETAVGYPTADGDIEVRLTRLE